MQMGASNLPHPLEWRFHTGPYPMRQFSLRELFGLVAAFCASLGLARIHFLIGAIAMVGYVVLVTIFGGSETRKRALIYGSVMGAAASVVLSIVVAAARGEFPVRSYNTPQTTAKFTRRYAIPIGAFVGGIAGWIYYGKKMKRDSE
jgi:hypothetical protein